MTSVSSVSTVLKVSASSVGKWKLPMHLSDFFGVND